MSTYRETAVHQAWVANGHCAAVSWSKTWCNRQAGHSVDHSGPYLHQGGKETQRSWPDSECMTVGPVGVGE